MKQNKRDHLTECEKTSEGFLSGVLVLSVSTVLVKIIGLAYKIPMIDRLGSVGMGYFNSAYEIYAILCTIATAGLPVALSMMIASVQKNENSAELHRIDQIAKRLFVCLGAIGSAVLFLFARPIASLIGNDEAYLCVISISPALFLACYSGAARGFFQGLQRMGPTAISQLLEALGKLLFGVLFATVGVFRGYSVPKIAACAMLGVTVGMFLSAAYLFFARHIGHHVYFCKYNINKSPVLRPLLQIAFPITLGSVLMSVAKVTDTFVMMHRLPSIGWSMYAANEIYGAYTTLAVPIFGLIPSLITPISLVLIPKLSAALKEKGTEEQLYLTEESIRLTVIFSLPSSLGIVVFAKPVLQLLFRNQTGAIDLAAPLLSILGFSIFFSGMITTTNAILQAYRHTFLPILSMLIGVALKGILAYILVGNPSVGALGAPISTFFCNASVTVMNLCFLQKCVPKGDADRIGMFRIYGKPLIASSAAVLIALFVFSILERIGWATAASCLAALFFAGAFYLIFLIWMGAISMDDMARIPLVNRLLKKGIFMKGKDKIKE